MQNSVNQQLTGLPKFRLHGLGFNAYGEGWALYAEQLGKEVGFYQDPVSDYGRLSSELFRAVRLVVDTGIHSKGWTREQVVEFMRKSGAVDEPTIQSETDRYIAWPAQALSYKLGQLKISELRQRAQKELGREASTSGRFMTRFSTGDHCRWICWRLAQTSGSPSGRPSEF